MLWFHIQEIIMNSTFNGNKSFKNLPDIVKNKIKEKCSKNGELLGAYSKIKDF